MLITEVAKVWIEDILDENNIIEPSNRLAWFYENPVDYPQAEYWYQKALTIVQERLPAQPPDIANTFNNLAALYRAQGRYNEAEPLSQEVLAIFEQSLGIDHPNTITIREHYQRFLEDKEEHQS